MSLDYQVRQESPNEWHLTLIEEAKSDNLTKRIRDYIEGTTGRFTTTQLDIELGLNQADKKQRSVILNRLSKDKMIDCEKKGTWRIIEKDIKYHKWWDAVDAEPIDVKLPLGLNNIVDVYPGDLIVVAGTSNAGKTAFVLNVARDNKDTYNVVYQTCELTDVEFKHRIKLFGDDIEDWKYRVNMLFRNNDYDNVIVPDALNIVDYLEPPAGEYYKVEQQLSAIHDKLTTGIAIVSLQKNEQNPFGVGGNMSVFRPRLYLTLNPGKCTIIKTKHPKGDTDPTNTIIKYKVRKGCELILT